MKDLYLIAMCKHSLRKQWLRNNPNLKEYNHSHRRNFLQQSGRIMRRKNLYHPKKKGKETSNKS